MGTQKTGGGLAIADPELEYSVDLGITVDFELSCSTLGLREMGICATGFHEMFSKCIHQMIDGAGYCEEIATISDDLIISLDVRHISKGSLKGRFKIKLPASLRKFAKEHGKKVLVGTFAAICTAAPSVLSNGAIIDINSTGLSGVLKSAPQCTIDNEVASVLENLSKTNDEVVFKAASSGCKIEIKTKKK